MKRELEMDALAGSAQQVAFALGPVLAGPHPGAASRALAGAAMRPIQGRWLAVHLDLAGDAAELRLAVALPASAGGAPWCAHRLAPGRNAVFAFLPRRAEGLRLEGPAAALAAVRLAGVELLDAAPPPEATVSLPMRTAARLHELGVMAMREIEYTNDGRWPLRSVGLDPQLRFAAPTPRGRYALSVGLACERGDASPVIYLDRGGGFEHSGAVALGRAADGSYRGERHFGGRCVRWRLDPADGPGGLRLESLELERVQDDARPWAGLRERVAGLLSGLRRVRDERDLAADHELAALDADGRFRATGDDPRFRLAQTLPAGWHMVEATLELPGARAQGRLYLDEGRGESEDRAFPLPLRSGKVCKRLLWLERPARLRFDPMAAPGEFRLTRFRVARVSAGFAASRMRRKLEAWRNAAGREAERARLADMDGAALWREYCEVFEREGRAGIDYADWIREVEEPSLPSRARQLEDVARWAWKPSFSVLLPTFNTDETVLRACLDSVLAQTYPHWELCVADDASTEPRVARVLAEYAGRDPRVKVRIRERNGHISRASNTALEMASGDFVALLDHDDLLAPHALYAVADALQRRPSALLVYSDEDKLDESGRRCDPYFKPDWSPDLLTSQNYFSHLGVYRRELVHAVGGFREGFEGSQDYDLVLRCVARVRDPKDILHVPQVLYHWRMSAASTARGHGAKDYATDAARRALQEFFDARHPGVRVSVTAPGLYRAHWPLPDPPPLVSLIVPTRDGLEVLRTCIESIVERTTYPNYEILVVDNQSADPATLAYLDGLPTCHGERVRVLRYDHPFNYSAINNFAAGHARGSVLGLINNDVEVISPEWLTEMVSHAVRPDIGCVGAKLYYPDDTIQHAGVVLGIGGVAGHSHKYFPREADGYFSRLRIVHEVSAVTGAALLVRKDVFEQVGGLDARDLQVAFNDVDLCLKVRQSGCRNLLTPFAELVHHESKTRGADDEPSKQARFSHERQTMLSRWGPLLCSDPHYSRNLTRLREDYSLAALQESFALDASMAAERVPAE